MLAILALPSMTGQMIALDGGQHLQWGAAGRGEPRSDARSPDADRRLRHVFLRDMVLQASIGVYPHEHGARAADPHQRRSGVEDEAGDRRRDRLGRVVDYERGGRARCGRSSAPGHVQLVETLAERIAEAA